MHERILNQRERENDYDITINQYYRPIFLCIESTRKKVINFEHRKC